MEYEILPSKKNTAKLCSRVKLDKFIVMISASLTDRGLANKTSKIIATTGIIRELDPFGKYMYSTYMQDYLLDLICQTDRLSKAFSRAEKKHLHHYILRMLTVRRYYVLTTPLYLRTFLSLHLPVCLPASLVKRSVLHFL